MIDVKTTESPCLKNTSRFNCDVDQDGIIDQCDTDIDGDGIENMLGILISETQDCTFPLEIIDTQRLDTQHALILNGANRDNCFLAPNQEQSDKNKDSYGDVCDEDKNKTPKDTDKDGIIDEKDACITIPENYNGKEDKDGCPELNQNTSPKGNIKADTCTQCPCQKADYGAQLME
jgi:hypothetical protein